MTLAGQIQSRKLAVEAILRDRQSLQVKLPNRLTAVLLASASMCRCPQSGFA
jgi:hypothetical protein